MKRNHVFKIAFALTLTSFFSLFVTGVTFSWFIKDNKITFDGEIGTTQANYYESGDGSESTPFIISNPRHLYNLAWLQYLGTYNQKDDDGNIPTYYFEIKNDIDMSGYVLPPIGTESNPFLSNFNANNCTISNLIISNVIDDGYIETYPSVVDKDTFNKQKAIVGFFGVIGTYNSSDSTIKYETSKNEVKNLYLDNLTITSKKDNLLIGVFAGYVNGTIDNCGVHYVKMNIKGATTKLDSFDNVSKFTLIGDYNKEKYKYDDDPDGSGDIGYGTSTDIKALHLSLIENGLNDGTTGQIKSKYVIPFKSENYNLVQGTGDKITITTSGSVKQTITPSNYYTYKASAKGNNLGYYVGEMKTYELSLDYNISDFGVQSGYTNPYLKTPPDDVLSYLKSNGTHLIRLNNGFTSDNLRTSTFSYVQNGQVGSRTGNLILPSNGIWVAPKENGTFKFVFYNASYGKSGNSGSVGLLFTELQRTTPGDYSSAFVANSLQCTGVSYSCKYGYFEKEAKINNEYYIAFYNTASYDAPYIAYMDIGVNGGDTPTDDRTSLANFDFVTKDSNSLTKIKTKNDDGTYSTNNDYSKSNVTFKIGDTTGDTTLAFRRIDQDTNGVLYYQSVDSILTPSGTGKNNEASDDNCNSKKS